MITRHSRSISIGALLFVAPAIVVIVLYACASQPEVAFASVASCALAVGGAAFLVGALFGFLFGIPRSATVDRAAQDPPASADAAAEQSGSRYRPNTNLEQISDWLTKILVGVGLTQLSKIPDAVSSIASALSPVLGGAPRGGVFGVALVLYLFVGGFFSGYLWTRIMLGVAFRDADADAARVLLRDAGKHGAAPDANAVIDRVTKARP